MNQTISKVFKSKFISNFLLSVILIGLASCGGGSATNSATQNVTTVSTPAGIAEFTTLSLSNLANYAAPVLPAYYDATVIALDNTPANNAVNDKVATLGRVLFYDKRLSINDSISCSSCQFNMLCNSSTEMIPPSYPRLSDFLDNVTLNRADQFAQRAGSRQSPRLSRVGCECEGPAV